MALLGLSPCFAQTFDQEGVEINGDFPEILFFEVVDFDSDGDLDLFLTCGENQGGAYQACELYYLENDSEARFQIHPLITFNDDGYWWIRRITCVDFDGDGDLDILIPGGAGRDAGWHSITILFHEGDLEFSRHSFLTGELEPYLPYEVKAIDFDGNGLLDLVVGFFGLDPRGTGTMWGGLYAYRQTDSLEFSTVILDEWAPLGGFGNLQLIRLVEEDEIVLFTECAVDAWIDDKVLWRWEQEEFSMTILPPGNYRNLRWCDWDGDGRLDYLAWGYPPSDTVQIPAADSLRVRLFLQNDEGEFEYQPLTPGLEPYPDNLKIADFDGNGRPDAFFTAPRRTGSILFNYEGENELIEVLHEHPRLAGFRFNPTDLNNDGRIDLIASKRSEVEGEIRGNLVWFKNLGPSSTPEVGHVESPESFEFLSAFPNPFNSTTTITFQSVESVKSVVRLAVYDLHCREVTKLAIGEFEAGKHSFVWNALNASTGEYFVKAKVDGKVVSKSITLVK